MADFSIQAISFEVDGILITYGDLDSDIRVNGQVQMSHQVFLHGSHPDYREDAESLRAKAVRVLKNALEDFHDSEPFKPGGSTDVEDEDQLELGMGE